MRKCYWLCLYIQNQQHLLRQYKSVLRFDKFCKCKQGSFAAHLDFFWQNIVKQTIFLQQQCSRLLPYHWTNCGKQCHRQVSTACRRHLAGLAENTNPADTEAQALHLRDDTVDAANCFPLQHLPSVMTQHQSQGSYPHCLQTNRRLFYLNSNFQSPAAFGCKGHFDLPGFLSRPYNRKKISVISCIVASYALTFGR